MATEVGALPDDALAAVFHALPPRSLAVVRCVCKAWRDVVDGRALLLPHIHRLPRTVRGVFMNCVRHSDAHYFARPCSSSPSTTTTVPRVDGTLSFLPDGDGGGGGVPGPLPRPPSLCQTNKWCGEQLCVCNPATRRWTVLPGRQQAAAAAADGDELVVHNNYAGGYVAFDPAESPHYQVILVPALPEVTAAEEAQAHRRNTLPWEEEEEEEEKDATPFSLDSFFSLPEDGTAASSVAGQWEIDDDDPFCYMEWPPAPWTLRVFSSSTGQWEDRDFVREGSPAGTVEGMRFELELPDRPRWRYAVYRHGSLYVHCRGSFVTRLSLSETKYQIIEMPTNVSEDEYGEDLKPYLGKLHNGVCFGTVNDDHQLKIWILNESCGQMEWVLKYETMVEHYAEYLASIASDCSGRQHDGSWTVEENSEIQDSDHAVESLSEEEENIEIQGHDVESQSKEGHEWDSDNDDLFTMNAESDNESQESYDYDLHLNIIGFHPYKEVVLMVGQFHVVAYHLNSTKIQYLGNSRPKSCYHTFWSSIYESFLYTPCMIGDLLHGDDETGRQSSGD